MLARTKFTKAELQALYRGFKSVSAGGGHSGPGPPAAGTGGFWCHRAPDVPDRSVQAASWTRKPSPGFIRGFSPKAVSEEGAGGAEMVNWHLGVSPGLTVSPRPCRRQRLRALLVRRLRRRPRRGSVLPGERNNGQRGTHREEHRDKHWEMRGKILGNTGKNDGKKHWEMRGKMLGNTRKNDGKNTGR